MKVVVTGAAGYMGKYVVKELLNSGHQVYAIDFNHKEIDSRAEILDVDIFSGSEKIYHQQKTAVPESFFPGCSFLYKLFLTALFSKISHLPSLLFSLQFQTHNHFQEESHSAGYLR